MEPPLKKQRKALMSDSSSDEDSGSESGGVEVGDLKINEEYAKRFEYNKKREELAKRMEGYSLLLCFLFTRC
jgi:protein KRI1